MSELAAAGRPARLGHEARCGALAGLSLGALVFSLVHLINLASSYVEFPDGTRLAFRSVPDELYLPAVTLLLGALFGLFAFRWGAGRGLRQRRVALFTLLATVPGGYAVLILSWVFLTFAGQGSISFG